jgi:chromosomal replication initiation ATPase DnaA
MKKSQSISTIIMDELLTTVEIIGLDKTIKTLQDAKMQSLTIKNVDIEFIINVVCEICNVSKDRLMIGNERSDEKKIAMALCVYFLKSTLLYSYSEIKKIFNKDESALYRYYQLVEERPKKPKTEFDKNLETSYKKVNLILTEKKLKDGK